MKKALLVIDVQYEYFIGKLPITYPAGSFPRILKAIDHANSAGIPVFIIQHSAPENSPVFAKGTQAWEIHQDVIKRPHKALIEKTLPGSFTGTELEKQLSALGIDTVAICGYMTQMCCDTTSRQAAHMGLNVEFLSDATGTLDISNYAGKVYAEELHRAILVTQAMRFSKVMTEEDWEKTTGK